MRFDKFLEEMLSAAREEARDDGSSMTEAHHLLLALAGSGEPSVTLVLATFGLDHGAISSCARPGDRGEPRSRGRHS